MKICIAPFETICPEAVLINPAVGTEVIPPKLRRLLIHILETALQTLYYTLEGRLCSVRNVIICTITFLT